MTRLLAIVLSSLALDVSAAIFTVSNVNDAGPGSLRQALHDVNADTYGEDSVIFRIPGPGPHTIQLLSPLPVIRAAVSIDGRSQAGYFQTPVIEISGTSAGFGSGLVIDTNLADVTILALAITGFASHGIEIRPLTYDTAIGGCYIGVRPDGRTPAGNGGFGIASFGEASGIGGNFSSRNVISGNGAGGILATGTVGISANRIGTAADGVTAMPNRGPGIRATGFTLSTGASLDRLIVAANAGNGIEAIGVGRVSIAAAFIGTDATGLAALPNRGHGIVLRDPTEFATIGDDNENALVPVNVISGNEGHGVFIESTTGSILETLLIDNAIGAGLDLKTPVPNGGDGVRIAGARDVWVGDMELGVGNVIAFNAGNGVTVAGANAFGNPITNNSFAGNGGLPIDLGADGPTANDPGDTDQGANDRQNFPLVTRAVFSGSTIMIDGTVDGPASVSYRIDLYANGRFIQSVDAASDLSGHASFTATTFGLKPGDQITATATDRLRWNTSEMSPPVAAANEAGVLQLTASAVTVREGTTISLDVVRVGGASGTVSIEYGVGAGGTASPGDYFLFAGRLTFNHGETRKTIAFTAAQDSTPEPDETLLVELRRPSGGALQGEPYNVTITIADDDAHLLTDVAVTLDTPARVDPGKIFNWRVTLANYGPGTATKPQVALSWSAQLAMAYAPPGCVNSGTSIVCSAPTLAPYASITFDLAGVAPPYESALTINAEASVATVDVLTENNQATSTFVSGERQPRRRSVRH
ncbi:MAG TPA: Calx-beta domain-containing protein [Thermoanaerobaculia bacterium]|jgi:hypothetical protein